MKQIAPGAKVRILSGYYIHYIGTVEQVMKSGLALVRLGTGDLTTVPIEDLQAI